MRLPEFSGFALPYPDAVGITTRASDQRYLVRRGQLSVFAEILAGMG